MKAFYNYEVEDLMNEFSSELAGLSDPRVEKNREEFLADYAEQIDAVQHDKVPADMRAQIRNQLREVMEAVGFKRDGAAGKEDFLEQLGRFWDEQQNQNSLKLSRSAMKDADANIRRGREAMNRAIVERADQNGRCTAMILAGWILCGGMTAKACSTLSIAEWEAMA